jgi:protein-S-isoprenylcysteine O-methyltransferase Ste14
MTAAQVIFAAVLFISAGRLDWIEGWAYLGLNLLTQVLCALVLIPRRPDLIAERSKTQDGTKAWDRFLAPGMAVLGPLAILITAGLDARYGWSAPIGRGLWESALALGLCCSLFVLWAMESNPFFAATVRIQEDRGHSVVSRGPYRLVRHPGYLGSVIFDLAAPLMLGSWWAILPVLLTIGVIVVRTGLEDRTLHEELPGYREYAVAVPYRLIPGIW